MNNIELVAKDIAETVRSTVKKTSDDIRKEYDEKISLLQDRAEQLEVMLKNLPSPEKGEKGESVTVEDLEPILKQMVDQIPSPKDGESPSPEDVAKAMEHHFAKWALDFERKADAVLSKAAEKLYQPKDGKDAIELEDFEISLDNDMRTVKMSLKRGDHIIERSLKIPSIIDRGVFKHGHEYEKGDGVTYSGSFWIAQKDAPEGAPLSGDQWRLAVKRGRDGKEAVKIELPETVKVDV